MKPEFDKSEVVTIQEWLDGKNMQITMDDHGNFVNSHLGCFDVPDECIKYIKTISERSYPDLKNKTICGVWLDKDSTTLYKEAAYNKFYVYMIKDAAGNRLPVKEVRDYCIKYSFLCADCKYTGRFKSKGFIEQFIDQPSYGDKQAGIFIYNESKECIMKPEDFTKPAHAVIDIAQEAARRKACEIITDDIVREEISSLIENQVLPQVPTARDLGAINRILPMRIYKKYTDQLSETINSKYINDAVIYACRIKARTIIP